MYDPLNWYWMVSGNAQKVWSSARLVFVMAADDAPYKQWQAAGNTATTIGSLPALVQVMVGQFMPLLALNGVRVVCTSDNTLSATYAIDDRSIANMTALASGIAAGKPLPSGQDTFIYRSTDGVARVFNAAQFLAFATALEAYVYQTQEAITSRILNQNDTTAIPSQPVAFS